MNGLYMSLDPVPRLRMEEKVMLYFIFSRFFSNLTHHLRQKCIFNVKQLDMVE